MRFPGTRGSGLYGEFYSDAVAAHAPRAPSTRETRCAQQPLRHLKDYRNAMTAFTGILPTASGRSFAYADVWSALRNHARFSSEGLSSNEGERNAEVPTPRNVLFSDPRRIAWPGKPSLHAARDKAPEAPHRLAFRAHRQILQPAFTTLGVALGHGTQRSVQRGSRFSMNA